MKLDLNMIVNVMIALVVFKLVDKFLLSKVPFLSYEEDLD